MNQARLLLTVGVAISCVSGMPFTARAQAPAEFSGRLCVPMLEMQAFQEAFKADAELLRKMVVDNAAINVVSAGDRYQLSSQNPALSRTVLAKSTPAASSCVTSPAEESVKTIGSTKAAYIASFDVVTSYRQNHQPWPLGAINLDPSRVDVVAARYAQYVIVSPSGTHPDGFGTAAGNFCAWHNYTTSAYGDIAFSNMPYVSDQGTSCGENFVNSGAAGILDGFSIVNGHEYAETLTDQNPSGGWTASSGAEDGDECAWISSGIGASANVSMGNGAYAMQSTWSNDTSECDISHPIL